MARPAEFDSDRALVAAMQLFWRQGYSATSLAQLLDEMSIGRSSFYAAFGDKRSLYVEALTLFSERTRDILMDAGITGPTARIRHFFIATLTAVPRHRVKRGCMMVNTVLELSGVDDEVGQLASAYLDQIESEFESLLVEAEEASFQSVLPPAQGARYLMTVNQGLRVAARQNRSRRELLAMIDDALMLLGIPTAG